MRYCSVFKGVSLLIGLSRRAYVVLQTFVFDRSSCLLIPTKRRGFTHCTVGRGVVRQQQVDKCIMDLVYYHGFMPGRNVERRRLTR